MRRKVLVALITLTIVIGWLADEVESQEFVTDGLIGFWSLDKDTINGDVVKDVWGKNEGTINGDPKSVPGKIDEALEFDGQDDYVMLPDMGNEPEVTVEAWVKAHSFPIMAGLVSTAPTDQWKPGTTHFKIWDSGIDIDKNDGSHHLRIPAKTEEWYHAAYTSNTEKDEIKLYVNGELVDEGITGAAPNNLTHIRFASEHDGRYFPGIIDEVRIYNRVKNEKEIKQNFNVKSNELAVDTVGKLAITWASIKAER